MGLRAKQNIQNREILNVLEALKEMFRIPNHQEKENQNDPENLPYTYQNG